MVCACRLGIIGQQFAPKQAIKKKISTNFHKSTYYRIATLLAVGCSTVQQLVMNHFNYLCWSLLELLLQIIIYLFTLSLIHLSVLIHYIIKSTLNSVNCTAQFLSMICILPLFKLQMYCLHNLLLKYEYFSSARSSKHTLNDITVSIIKWNDSSTLFLIFLN